MCYNANGKFCITNTSSLIGTFSNSAATNARLAVRFLIDESDIAFKLYEYGSSEVKNYSGSSSDTYQIAILDTNGDKHRYTGTIYSGGDRIFFSYKVREEILALLGANSSLTFSVVEDSKYSKSTYLFKIEDTSYFSNAYNELTK